ncbi:MAG: hypothetical protein WC881_08425 [Elusimicrobiota bacterium]
MALSSALILSSPDWGGIAAFAAPAAPAKGGNIAGLTILRNIGADTAARNSLLNTAPLVLAPGLQPLSVPALKPVSVLRSGAVRPLEAAAKAGAASAPQPQPEPAQAAAARLAGIQELLDKSPVPSQVSPAQARESGHALMDAVLGQKNVSFSDGLPTEPIAGTWASLAPGLFPARPSAADAEPAAASVPASLAPAAARPARSWAGRIADKVRAKAKVFSDPQRNKDFWKFFLGFEFSIAGLQLCMVAFPYMIKSFAHGQGVSAAMSEADAATRLNRMRSQIRAFQLGAQILSYLSLPFLARGKPGSDKKLLVRAGLLRAGILILVPLHFLIFSGLMPAAAAFAVLAGIFAVQSYGEGVHGGMTDMLRSEAIGSSDVTPEERNRANSLLSFAAALISIVVPVFAGKLAQIPDIMGREGSGSAMIFAVYAGVMAISSAFYALTAVRARKAAKRQAAAGVKGPGFKAALKAIARNRFFRTILMLDGFAMLIGEPLMNNVLPNFVESVLKASSVSIGQLLQTPVLGWIFSGMMNTPMGYFGLLIAFGSIGSALASALNQRVLGFLHRHGYASEESRMLPLYGIDFLEVLAFAGIVLLPAFWPILMFWMLKSLAGGFVGVARDGVYQKNLAAYPEADRPAMISMMSLANMLMTLGGALVYLFVLSSIPVGLSMSLAFAGIAALGALRLFSPKLMFDKAARSKT